MPLRKSLLALLIIIVSGIVLLSLYISGSPMKARAERFDTQRINDLQQISYAIDSFWTINRRLPNALDELVMNPNQPAPPYYLQNIKDPQTSQLYEFSIDQQASSTSPYHLCATFQTSNQPTNPQNPPYTPYNPSWLHNTGRTCYELQIHTLNTPPPIK